MKSIGFVVGLLLLQMAQAQLPGGDWTIDPDHVPKDPYIKTYNKVSSCEVRTSDKVFQLNEPTGDVQNALLLMQQTPSGKKLIEQFNKLNKQYPHEFKELNYNVRRSMNFPPQIGAVYVYDGQSKPRIIYYDPQNDLGLVTIMLTHEITHALDSDVQTAYHKQQQMIEDKVSKEQYKAYSDEATFKIERKAFSQQDRIYPEFMKLSECYESFLQEHRDLNGLKLYPQTSNEFIIDRYNLK